jgi:hypothetical protein
MFSAGNLDRLTAQYSPHSLGLEHFAEKTLGGCVSIGVGLGPLIGIQ